MAYDVVLGVWCAVFGGLAAWCGGRFLARGPWRQAGTARVLRVWERELGKGWRHGVPAEVACVDPVGGRELVGTTRGGEGSAGELAAAWPGRELAAFVRLRRPDEFRVRTRLLRFVDAYLFGLWSFLALAAVPLAARALFGRHSLVVSLPVSVGVWLLVDIAIAVVHGTAEGRHRRRLLASAQTATAVVIDFTETWDPAKGVRKEALMTPVLSFTTDEGVQVTATCSYKAATKHARRGDEVAVRYAPADPSVFTVLPPAEKEELPDVPAEPARLPGWIRADGVRVRADRVTAVEIARGRLLLRTLDHAGPLSLTPPAPATREQLEALADELVASLEPGGAEREGPRPALPPAGGPQDAVSGDQPSFSDDGM
ncbi:DUF3592 domain-containing protein [Streptomyces sp. NPDC020917]|uniref:DUF3592 domain-containing protein n=1 Tax=Streptomyces sp. NPDC020917 TaxID=3365102 RepID=UPI003797B68F